MFEKAKEYFKFGAGRPPGTMWSMEKAYFELRRRYPGLEEYAYLRLALQTRYPEKKSQIEALTEKCGSLDDAIATAVEVDFGQSVGMQVLVNVLWNLPPCSRCGKYRSLSTSDDLCYGCRTYPGFAACTRCHLYWDDSPTFCQRCGGLLWRITDGPGVPMIQVGANARPDAELSNESPQADAIEANDDLVQLVSLVDGLEARCATIWEASAMRRREYRRLRRAYPELAQERSRQYANPEQDDKTLISDLDQFFDRLCSVYLGGDAERRAEIRSLMESNRRLLGNLHNYAGRCAIKLSSTGKPEYLLRGLAAISIYDSEGSQDYGYTLARLYSCALPHGLEPSGFFSTVAKLSGNRIRGVFENFESSQDFANFVRPYLKK